jgi:hypothetical protein
MAPIMISDRIEAGTEQRCPNCSAELNGSFCSACGQRQVDLDKPFRELTWG